MVLLPALGVAALSTDPDRLTPACEAGKPGCQRAGRVAPLVIEEFHPITWTVSNAKGFTGGAGRLEGGQTTPAGIFVAPAPGELLKAPQTSSILPSICAAIRCTEPMKASRPPPTMPMRSVVMSSRSSFVEGSVEGDARKPH